MNTPILAMPPLPLVGRSAELDVLRTALDGASAGRGATIVLSGEGGVGKTRLVSALQEDATHRGWLVAAGRAYPVEQDVPYALFADALIPPLKAMRPDARAAFTRGVDQELAYLFPALGSGERPRFRSDETPRDFKNRLLWNFTQMLKSLTVESPLLVVLEDLQWADASSLELLHFIARQTGSDRVLLACTCKSDGMDDNPALRATANSLAALGIARTLAVQPLDQAATDELVRRTFGLHASVATPFTAMFYGWTRGNPFFIEETLKWLVESGRLRFERGHWQGWDVRELVLPPSIREALVDRVRRLPANARALADLMAVLGAPVRFDVIGAVAGLDEPALAACIDVLLRAHLVREQLEGSDLFYDFSHPLIRETLYTELGLTRARLLHTSVAEALEAFHGGAALAHAGELAYHFSRAHSRAHASKAAVYLAAAGRDALDKHADREAANYLQAAMERAGADSPDLTLTVDLARARQRLGDYDGALELWGRALDLASREGDSANIADVRRRIGLALFWSGRPLEALAHYDAGLAAAQAADHVSLLVRIALARALCLQELGRPAEAKQEAQRALIRAETGGPELLARVHRALMLLHVWTGPSETARAHGQRAIQLAGETNDLVLAYSAHWAMAMLHGISGSAAILLHLDQARRIVETLRSPVLQLWTNELEIEYAAAVGEWDTAVAVGDHAIELARALHQRTLLPRLLVWTGLVYFGRNELERGRACIDEAWDVSGAAHAERAVNVHTVVPAHIGLAGYHLATGAHAEAIRVGEAGVALADRSGYLVWAIYKLLPIVAEACLWMRDLERARSIGQRLRRDSEALGHTLGLAWADACDALVQWLSGDLEGGTVGLRRAAERLEAVPFIPDAARLRRQLAGRLNEMGDREGARRELRAVHDVFVRLRAERELAKTRDMFRQAGLRPPVRVAAGAAGLTGRELEIARLVGARRSNKAIGRALDISPRTVSTHLSNIFRKLGLASRGDLIDYIRVHEPSRPVS